MKTTNQNTPQDKKINHSRTCIKRNRYAHLGIKFIVTALASIAISNSFSQTLLQSPVSMVAVQNVQPTGILSFTADYYEGTVYLNWVVLSDTTDKFYYIKRSDDGNHFSTLGLQQGLGTPVPVKLTYSFQDSLPLPGNAYYQLVMMEQDGALEVSQPIILSNPVKGNKINNSPLAKNEVLSFLTPHTTTK